MTEGAPKGARADGRSEPADTLLLFRERLAAGRVEDIGEVFSFPSAYEYWHDIAVSTGLGEPDEGGFRKMLESLFASSLVRGAVSDGRISAVATRIIGSVASVVFERSGRGQGVATLVNENGVWKVRTYPGVFPGDLLSLISSARKPKGERVSE